VKCKKIDLICQNNKTYETIYIVPFIVLQQRINKKFIMMNNDIIQLKIELRKRSRDYLANKGKGTAYAQSEGVEDAIDDVFNDVISKMLKT
jgi:hypothetical protein